MSERQDTPFFLRMGTFATAACFADFATYPFDVAKVRLQVQGEALKPTPNGAVVYRGLFGTITTIVHNEGFRSLFNGLSAGLQRQLCFSSIRLGCYDSVKEFYTDKFLSAMTSFETRWQLMNSSMSNNIVSKGPIFPTSKDTDLSGLNLTSRIAAGLTTGFVCVLVAQPTDVVKIRFQAMTKSNSTKDRYNSTREAYRKIYRNEGFAGLWKGTISNATRNSLVNVTEIVVYDIVKDLILLKRLMNDNIFCHFTTASIAGLCTTFVASPVDVVKTRYMNSPKGYYSGAMDCTIRTLQQEGVSAFYKGFIPSFCRIASWNIILWVTFEQLRAIEKKYRAV